MTKAINNNNTARALQKEMATAKKWDEQAKLEWEIACNTSYQRGYVYSHDEMKELYDRYGDCCDGATKAVHKKCHNGKKFKYIVVKRFKPWGYIPNVFFEHEKCTGNQLIDEIGCWNELSKTEWGDLLAPILKYFTSKSDKVSAISETMLENVVIISQKAVEVDDAYNCCEMAYQMNERDGLIGESVNERFHKMKELSRKMGWRDALGNSGNSGVIFDYYQNCWKAVFIDYAL